MNIFAGGQFHTRNPHEAPAKIAAARLREELPDANSSVAANVKIRTACDPAIPSIKVRTADGHSMSAKVEDKKNIEGVKVGDKVTVTFTEALMITVEAPKK